MTNCDFSVTFCDYTGTDRRLFYYHILKFGCFGNYEIITVNLKIFTRVLFLGNFAYAKFLDSKILTKWRDHSFAY